jgi:hypothetical protein
VFIADLVVIDAGRRMPYNGLVAPEELVPRDELRATLAAQRELGPAYEDEVLDRFAAELERRIEARLPERRRVGLQSDQKTGIVIVSIIAAIPLIAIASGAGLSGVIAVCVALVLVNALALRS